jgi:hypothetical protein
MTTLTKNSSMNFLYSFLAVMNASSTKKNKRTLSFIKDYHLMKLLLLTRLQDSAFHLLVKNKTSCKFQLTEKLKKSKY